MTRLGLPRSKPGAMRISARRFACASLPLLAGALIGCSGNSPAPGIQATPARTEAPNLAAAGLVVGSSFYYVGSSQNEDTTYDGSAAERVTGTTTGTGSESNNERVLGNVTFAGIGGLYDVYEAVSAAASQPADEFFDNYETVAASRQGEQVLYVGNGYHTLPAPGNTFSYTVLNAAPIVIDMLPHVKGATWMTDPANTYQSTETNPSIGTLDTTIATASDASYTRSDNATYPGGTYVQDWKMNADFSGSQRAIYGNDPYPQAANAIAAPSSGTIVASSASGSGSAPPLAASTSVPDWYPAASGTASPVLYGQTTSDAGLGPLPAACRVGSRFAGLPVWDIRTILRSFDVWGDGVAGGTYSVQTQDEYVNDAFGELCLTDSSSLSAYSWQTGYLVERDLSTGALALQTASFPSSAFAPIRGDAAPRLRAAIARFLRGLRL
jgi:hypothetical protein